MMKKVAVLVVGGGAAGFVTAAYLSAVEKFGLEYSQIHGTSSGAINAAAFQSHGAEGIKDMWLRIENRDVYKNNVFTWLELGGKKAACYDSSPLKKLLPKYVSNEEIFYNDKQKLFVSVTDISEERSLSINLSSIKDDIVPWVHASASPPFFFAPVPIGKKQYWDGGLGELVNISFAIQQGADTLVILCPRGRVTKTEIKNGLDAISFSVRMPLNYMLEKELRIVELMNSHPGKRHIDTLLIRPEHALQPGILDFDDLGDLPARKSMWEMYEQQALNELHTFFHQHNL